MTQTAVSLVLTMVLMGLNVPRCRAQTVNERVLAAQRARMEVIEKASESVIAIFGLAEQGGGSGVVISPDGFAISNYHVTSAAGDFMKCGMNDGRLYDAVIVGVDPTGDVALLKLFGRTDFPAARIADSNLLQPGDWVYAMGNPFLLATDFTPTVTYGIVSGTHRYQYPAGSFLEYTDCIQIDASINPGNSGGPLFNAQGELVGINGRASFEKRGRINSGAAYAISINQVMNFLDHLKSGRIVDHGSLEATVAATLDGTIVIDRILETSPAWHLGAREGSEIFSFAGRPVRSVNQFKNLLGIYPNGWKLSFSFREGGEVRQSHVRLRPLHSAAEMSSFLSKNAAPKPRPTRKSEPKVPEQYRKWLVRKPGFANYYFNELAQKRLRKRLAAWGDYSNAQGTWVLSGRASGTAFEFVLADRGLGLTIGKNSFAHEAGAVLGENEPPTAPGLLTAMGQLRKLLLKSDSGFTDFYYFGAEPMDGLNGPKADVLRTEDGTIVSRWYFARSDGAMLGFDTRMAPDMPGCEIRFAGLRKVQGITLPGRLHVQTNGQSPITFDIQKIDFPKKAQ